MRPKTIQSFGIGLMLLAMVCAPGAALAQDASAQDASANAADTPPPPADTPLTPDESAAIAQALTFDPATLDSNAPVKKLRLPSLASANSFKVTRTDKPDGSSIVAVKQPLPVEWDAHVGADIGLAANPPVTSQPSRPLPGAYDGRGSGAAWASVGVLPNLATVDARLDPANDQGKLGTSFKHSMPLGSQFSVTLQDSYSVTETFSASTSAAPASAIPLMTAPAVAVAPQASGEIWGNEKAAKFDVLRTGTSFGVKLASNSIDPVTHNTFSADQKLYGPLHISTAVTDLGQPTSSKSITAGFKLNW